MTAGTALTVVEVDADVYRATQFEFAKEGEAVPHFTSEFGFHNIVGRLYGSAGFPLDQHGYVLMSSPTSEQFVFTPMPILRDVSILTQLRLPTFDGTVQGGCWIMARASGSASSEHYRLTLVDFSGVKLIKLSVVQAFLETTVFLQTVVTAADIDWNTSPVWVRFDVANQSSGVLLRAKIWSGGPEDEPDDFQYAETDAANTLNGPGHIGLGMFSNLPAYDLEVGFFRGKSLLSSLTETLSFARPDSGLVTTGDFAGIIPNVVRVSSTAATVSLGKDLGKRAQISVDFRDHPYPDPTGEFRDNGTFWGRFRARELFKRGNALRIKRGYVGQALSSFTTFHYLLDTFDGPSLTGGKYTIKAQDILKFADDDRAQAPRISNGVLAGSIVAGDTSATLSPVNIGDAEYPTSGLICLSGKEIVSFTRSGEQLTITRAQHNTTAIAHDAGARAQLILNYDGDDVADIIADLLENYADIDSSFIPLTEWQQETSENLAVIYARPITEPTPVRKLLSELIEQAALALWWDDQAQLLRLKVLREIATDTDTFSEDQIIKGSLQVAEQFDQRVSQIWTRYGQRNAADRGDNEDNYRNVLATVDLESEDQFGGQAIKEVQGNWIQTESAAERLNEIIISRFKTPPRNFKFDLWPGTQVSLGNGYRLKWLQNQTEYGQEVASGAPIQITKVSIEEGAIKVEAEEMLASGTISITTTIFLLTTGSVLSWTVDDTWNNADNEIHVIGGGGGGGLGNPTNAGDAGGGGGGGAYSMISNLTLTPGGSASYRVGSGGAAGTVPTLGDGGDGGDTWFNGASLATASVGAKGGGGAPFGSGDNHGAGGQASAGVGTLKQSGGDGGPGHEAGSNDAGGGGGGGAAGPNGDGGTGGGDSGDDKDGGDGGGGGNGGATGTEATANDGGAGGNNRFNFGGGAGGIDSSGSSPSPGDQSGGGGGGARRTSDGAIGGTGEQLWTQSVAPIISAGPGGGGGGGGSHFGGGDGGDYGGGGGGGGNVSGEGGAGAQGIIVIKWRLA